MSLRADLVVKIELDSAIDEGKVPPSVPHYLKGGYYQTVMMFVEELIACHVSIRNVVDMFLEIYFLCIPQKDNQLPEWLLGPITGIRPLSMPHWPHYLQSARIQRRHPPATN